MSIIYCIQMLAFGDLIQVSPFDHHYEDNKKATKGSFSFKIHMLNSFTKDALKKQQTCLLL